MPGPVLHKEYQGRGDPQPFGLVGLGNAVLVDETLRDFQFYQRVCKHKSRVQSIQTIVTQSGIMKGVVLSRLYTT